MTQWPISVLLLLSVVLSHAPGISGKRHHQQLQQQGGSHPYYHQAVTRKTTLTVGYLTAIKGDLKDRQGLAISGALKMALDEVNDSPDILPNVHLALRWNDTRGDTVLATRAMTEMICDGVSTFFGPEGPCHVEAIVSQSRNIPMISYVSNFNIIKKSG
uniref:CSON000721 protein n=1 Tax=Culicoides sonorensis TaxID=179676 RepID=A0A336KZJ8_CULSO